MNEATDFPTTPRRRLLLGAAALPVTCAPPAALAAAPAGGAAAADAAADAEVFRLAAEVERIEAAYCASFEPPARTREEERARDAEQRRLADLREDAAEQLAALTPRTLPGIVALARAAHALADKDRAGELVARDDNELLALAVVEHVAALGGPLPAAHPARLPPAEDEPVPPPPLPASVVEGQAEGDRLRALGLHRPHGFTVGDVQLVGWLVRRVAADMGEATAARVLALSGANPAHIALIASKPPLVA